MFLGDWSSTVPLSPPVCRTVPSPYAIACNFPFGSRRGTVDRTWDTTWTTCVNLHLDLSFTVTARRCAKGDWPSPNCGKLKKRGWGQVRDPLPIRAVHMKMELRYATSGKRDGDQLPDWVFQDPRSSYAMKVNRMMELSRRQTIQH